MPGPAMAYYANIESAFPLSIAANPLRSNSILFSPTSGRFLAESPRVLQVNAFYLEWALN